MLFGRNMGQQPVGQMQSGQVQAGPQRTPWGDHGRSFLEQFGMMSGQPQAQSPMQFGGNSFLSQMAHPAMQPQQRFQSPFARPPQMSLAQILMQRGTR